MSVNYNITVLTNRLQQVINGIDGGPSNGFMRLLDAGGSIVSSFQLSRPCGVAANGVLTFSGMSLIDPAAAGGTAKGARVEDSTGTFVITGLTVSTPGTPADILLTPTNIIAAGQTVAITAASITGN